MKSLTRGAILVGAVAAVLALAQPAQAQLLSFESVPVASESSLSAVTDASASTGWQLVQEKTDQDLTVPTSKVTDTLAAALEERPVKMQGWNFLQVLIRAAVSRGLPANIAVLLLLFPVIATIITFARYVIGVQSFGIYIPAVLSVAFVSINLWPGLIIFVLILLGMWFIKWLMRKVPLPSLSKTALTLWGISFFMLLVLLSAAYFNVSTFLSLSIFPILIMILLSEDFMNSQFFTNTRAAFNQTMMTVVLAMICALIVRLSVVQRFVIINPELTLVITLVANVLIGRYTGLRLLETWRFKSTLKAK